MFPSFGLVLNAILFVAGVWWCKEVLGRWRDDVEELREVEEMPRKAVIVIIWLLTIVIAVYVLNFGYHLAASIVTGVRDLMT